MHVESGASPGEWRLGSDSMYLPGRGQRIELRRTIRSVQIVSHSHTAARSGVGGAAAGAVLGFLLAGPVGTALGAAAGHGKGKQHGEERFRVRIDAEGHHRSITALVSPSELTTLMDWQVAAERHAARDASAAPAQPRPEPQPTQAAPSAACDPVPVHVSAGVSEALFDRIATQFIDQPMDDGDDYQRDWDRFCQAVAEREGLPPAKVNEIVHLSLGTLDGEDAASDWAQRHGADDPTAADLRERICAAYRGALRRHGPHALPPTIHQAAVREIAGSEGVTRDAVEQILDRSGLC